MDRFKSAILSRVKSDNLEFDPEDFETNEQETESNEAFEETDEDMLNFNAPETVTLQFLSDNS